jgi:hypothetical protein
MMEPPGRDRRRRHADGQEVRAMGARAAALEASAGTAQPSGVRVTLGVDTHSEGHVGVALGHLGLLLGALALARLAEAHARQTHLGRA